MKIKLISILFIFLFLNYQNIYSQNYNVNEIIFKSNVKLIKFQRSGMFKVKKNKTLYLTFNDSLIIKQVLIQRAPCGLCTPEIDLAPVLFNKNKLCIPLILVKELYKINFLDENVYGYYHFRILLYNNNIIDLMIVPK